MIVKKAKLSDIDKLVFLYQELRPHRSLDYIKNILQISYREGYTTIYIENNDKIAAIAGFRILNMLYSGKTLYVDDLITDSACRHKGYARQLLDWLTNYCIEGNIETFSLDSGFQRTKAHKLYLNNNFEITDLHFEKKIIKHV